MSYHTQKKPVSDMGHLKDAKEWQMMVLTISHDIAKVMIDSTPNDFFQFQEIPFDWYLNLVG